MTGRDQVGRGSTPPLRNHWTIDGAAAGRGSTPPLPAHRHASGRGGVHPLPERPDPGARPAADDGLGIRGFLETSFLDWPGRIAAVLFLGGCTFRCPFCHNADLVLAPDDLPPVPLDAVLARLAPLRGWVDAVVVSGGEPTASPRLPELVGRLRSAGLDVKLDTNGSRPDVLARLLGRGALQAVDMDVKAPLEPARYAALAGVPVRLAEIRASVDLLALSGVPHRFRTTYVPGLLDRGDLERLRSQLPAGSPLAVQGFSPHRVLDPALAGVAPPSAEELRELRRLCEAPDEAPVPVAAAV